MRRGVLFIAAAALATTSASAVGFGPLRLDGVIDGPREGFALDLFNPYPVTAAYLVEAKGAEDETAQPRVTVLPAEAELGPERRRRVLVIVEGLTVGETYRFRVCAQRRDLPQGITIHARVCSKLSAHRIA